MKMSVSILIQVCALVHISVKPELIPHPFPLFKVSLSTLYLCKLILNWKSDQQAEARLFSH